EGAIPPYKSEMREYIDYQRNQIQRSNILVEMGERSDTNKLKEKNPDVVILATGSRSASRDFPGIGRQNVFTASDILHHPEQCKERVVIIGGGLIGCETAEFLAQHEKKVTIIEMLKRIGSDMGPDTRWVVRKRLTNAGVVLEINTKAVRIEEDGVVAAKDDSRCVFPADTVIIAWGMESNNDLEEPVKKSFPEVCSIGDCTSPQSVLEAVEQGYFAALRV
ncbi:MAG: NAD(P)/FAD-dependent oxidoreductase, partial [Dehalococcoidia bacterium]|nr:NAD(P)/FAD-dependent oxidoreductase [Dehalococcoidia bacterium]